MRIPGRRYVRAGWRWTRSRLTSRALVLGYHRVSDAAWDPYALNTHPDRFAAHLRAIRKFAHPVRLSELVADVGRGSLPRRAVAVTLDDGYVDNLEVALPLLEEMKIPATVFVVSDTLGREFWWDELVRLLEPNGRAAGIALDDDGTWVTTGDQRSDRDWTSLHARLASLPEDRRRAALDGLGALVGARVPAPSVRCMQADEVRRLAASPWIEIGSHTRTHPFLARLTEDAQRGEVTGSKRDLEDLTGGAVECLSYPNGSASAVTRRVVAEAGFIGACRSDPDAVRSGCDPYAIPRFWPPNGDGRTFTAWLRRWV